MSNPSDPPWLPVQLASVAGAPVAATSGLRLWRQPLSPPVHVVDGTAPSAHAADRAALGTGHDRAVVQV